MSSRDELKAIARRTMIQRGLLPDFSPRSWRRRTPSRAPPRRTPPSATCAACSGARDNDDSRDLDQLSVAEPTVGGTVKIRVAVADGDAIVRKRSAIDGHAWINTTSVYIAAEIFPMLPEKVASPPRARGQGT